jgi:hypothetical protein
MMRVSATAWKVIMGLLIVVPFSICMVLSVESDMVMAGLSAAENWLALVDEDRYAESWNEAAEYFKGAVEQEEWQESLQSVRKPFGEVISREVKTRSYLTSLPGAPDGEYVVIQFETSFENKKSAVETVIPMKDGDGRWRVSGYFIK